MWGIDTLVGKFLQRIFRSRQNKKMKSYRNQVAAINALEGELLSLSDSQLALRTNDLRMQVANGAPSHVILPQAFAMVREAARRTLEQRHYDVQLIGGMVLHEGCIAEMRTGEGKTLVATLPAYLNSVLGKKVHVVTVNDYLAKRDASWMADVYKMLGLSTGAIVSGMNEGERRSAYGCDITYATNNELGFDYLRDNMCNNIDHMVQGAHHFAIIDEVDSILIDEARTPLIISGPSDEGSSLYHAINSIVPSLTIDIDFNIDKKDRAVHLTEQGIEKLEGLFRDAGLLQGDSLYSAENITIVHHVQQALKAHNIFARDRDYIINDNSVIIIDEFTGRMMQGRRYSDGLHQALEAKENVPIQPENSTLSSITFQNYFRLYEKISGMTGTAVTESTEFMHTYGLKVIEIPTHMQIQRIDEHDEIYRTEDEKFKAVMELVESCRARSQPVLVGTASIEKSEKIAEILCKEGWVQQDLQAPPISHSKTFVVLNAKYHEQEAAIIAQAGAPGAVTIATNMAGRGTDIQLGGNAEARIHQELADVPNGHERDLRVKQIKEEISSNHDAVVRAGGLYVIGTERHESRRIDNQLRGRSGRQGDPGRSKFFISLEDSLMRIFGSQQISALLVKIGLKEGEAIMHPWINKAISKAQQRVESHNFELRKNLLKYDDAINSQRKTIFEHRKRIMTEPNIMDLFQETLEKAIESVVVAHIPKDSYPEQWDIPSLTSQLKTQFNLDIPFTTWSMAQSLDVETIIGKILDLANAAIDSKKQLMGEQSMIYITRSIMLHALDKLWREQLIALDYLRQVIGLRGYGQRDPLQEYKVEAFGMFENMLRKLSIFVANRMLWLTIMEETKSNLSQEQLETPLLMSKDQPDVVHSDFLQHQDISRNDPCPCNSGKRYKHCHGRC